MKIRAHRSSLKRPSAASPPPPPDFDPSENLGRPGMTRAFCLLPVRLLPLAVLVLTACLLSGFLDRNAPVATAQVTPGITVSRTSLSVPVGARACYDVRPTTNPATTLVFNASSGDATKATVSGEDNAQQWITDSGVNWKVPLVYCVKGVATGSTTISHSVTSTNTDYNGVTIPDVSVTVTAANTNPTVRFLYSSMSVVEGDVGSGTDLNFIHPNDRPLRPVTVKLDIAPAPTSSGQITWHIPHPHGGCNDGWKCFRVGYTGTAGRDLDYVAEGLIGRQVSYTSGSNNMEFTFYILSDNHDEDDETVRIYILSRWFDPARGVMDNNAVCVGPCDSDTSDIDSQWMTMRIIDDDAGSTACETCGSEGALGFVRDPNAPENPNADLIADVKEWRDDPRYVSDKRHTDRWDRVLLTLGEAVSDQTLQPMTATEAQGYADRGWTRWEGVAEALAELEAAAQQQDPPSTGPSQDPPDEPPAAPNNAPTVVHSPEDVTIGHERGSESVPLYTLVDDASLSSTLVSMFHDADGDDLTITASSSDEAVATVSVSGHTATVSARSRGTATITVTADDGRGGTASDDFDVTVKSAPTVASALSDESGLAAGTTREISLSGVFSDPDGDYLTITSGSDDDGVAAVEVASDYSTLTVRGVSAGDATISVVARDSDGNRASDSFDVSVTASQPRLLTPPSQQDPAPTREQDPTPTPVTDPGPTQEPETPDAVDRYDADDDGSISRTELGDAVKDYAAGEITYSEMLEVYMAYRAS